MRSPSSSLENSLEIPKKMRGRPVLILFALTILGLIWALSSPPGSSFDESYHIGSIWCAEGEVPGVCEVPSGETALGDKAQTEFVTDYCFYDGSPASCENLDPDSSMFVHSRFTNTSDFRNLFYRTMNLLILDDARASIPLMRFFNVLIFAGLIYLTSSLLTDELRRAAIWGVLLTLVPQGIFLIASINPSGWAISGLSTSWAFVLALQQSNSLKNRIAYAGVILGALILTTSRLEAPVYFIFAMGVVSTPWIRRKLSDPRSWKFLALVVPILLAINFRFVIESVQNLLKSFETPSGIDFHFYWLIHLVDIPALTFGANFEDFGPLGGGNILVPPIVPTIQISALVIVFYLSHRVFSKKVVVFHVATFIFVYCVLIQQLAVENTHNPYWVQGRYILPLIPFVLGYSIYLSGSARLKLPKNLMKMFFGLLTISHSVTLLTFIVRFSDGTVLDTVPRPSVVFKLDSWRYVSWIPSSALWIGGSVAFGLFLWAIYGILVENDPVQITSKATPQDI